jgi:hypothetical protein
MRNALLITITLVAAVAGTAARAEGNSRDGGAAARSESAASANEALRANGTRMPGPARPTVTHTQSTDTQIEAENRKLERKVRSICRGC